MILLYKQIDKKDKTIDEQRKHISGDKDSLTPYVDKLKKSEYENA